MTKKLEEPAGNASTDDWRAFATQEDPGRADAIAEMGRDELRDVYGSTGDKPAATPSDSGAPAALPNDPGQVNLPGQDVPEAFANVTPPVETEVPNVELFRVGIHPDRWDLDAVEFPYGPVGDTLRISRQAPVTVPESDADDIIKAAGERGFALTKEKVA